MKKATVNDYFKHHWAKLIVFALFTAAVSFFAPLKNFQLKWLIDSKSKQEALGYMGLVFLIRTNRITISAGTSGFLLPFFSAAISGIMPQKASFLKTFSTNCHILLDIVPFRVYNKGTRKPMTQNEAIEDKTERGKLHSPIKVPKRYRSLGNETSPAPGGKDKTERGKLYSPTAVSK